MRRGFAGAWFMAGLALIGAMVVGGREAQAGGVSVKLGVGQGGDPSFTYDAYVYLDADSTALANGSLSATFTGITGITNNSTDTISPLFELYSFPDAVWQVSLSSANGGTITIQELNSTQIGPFSAQTELFEVQIVTPQNTPAGLAPGDMVNVSTTLGGSPPVQGSITLFSIPEPSSMIMMLLGGAMLPFFAIRERTRRSRRVA
jgi:hypothetical protein